jgi:hypothetical protein
LFVATPSRPLVFSLLNIAKWSHQSAKRRAPALGREDRAGSSSAVSGVLLSYGPGYWAGDVDLCGRSSKLQIIQVLSAELLSTELQELI